MNMPNISPALICLVLLMTFGIVLAAAPTAPEITSEAWLNGEPTSMSSLKGKVVLVEFWTFGCWNCKNVEPYIKQWHKKYAKEGLVTLAVHSPEFRHERNIENVRKYLAKNDIVYPVPIDNDFSTWRSFENRAWPTVYLIDKDGKLVYSHIGEGAYSRTESKIRELLQAPFAAN